RTKGLKAAKGLSGKLASLKILDLPNLPPKGDITNWIEMGGTLAQLGDLVAAAPEFTKEEVQPDHADHDDAARKHASLKNAVEDILVRSLVIYYDEFLDRMMTGDEPPREWKDTDDLELTITLQSTPGFEKIPVHIVRDAVIAVAFRQRKNSVKDWLDSL